MNKCILLANIFFLFINTSLFSQTVGGTYRKVLLHGVFSLDPINADDSDSMQIIKQIYDSLVTIDSRLRLQPSIAESWTVSKDGRIYVFKIRKNIRFSNGDILTTDDVIFSLYRILGPKSKYSKDLNVKGANAYNNNKANKISGIYKTNNNSIAIELNAPDAFFLYRISSPFASIINKKTLLKNKDYFRKPNGTGPFKVETITQKIVKLKRNKYYFAGEVYLSELLYRVYSKKEAVSAFLNGELEDMAPFNLPSNVDSSKYQHIFTNGFINYAIVFNSKVKPFDNPNVRRAISLSLDVETILKDMKKKHPQLNMSNGYIPKGLPGYLSGVKGHSYNLRRAQELLKENGYSGFKALGKLKFYIRAKSSPMTTEIIKGLKEYLKKNASADLEIIDIPPKKFLQKFFKDELSFYFIGITSSYPDSFFPLKYFHSTHKNNFSHAKNSKIDSLLDSCLSKPKLGDRIDIYKAINTIIQNEAYVIPMYSGAVFDGYFQKWVKNIDYPPMAFFYMSMRSVWIDKNIKK